MTHENVRISTSYPNMTVIGGYYYNLDHGLDSLIVKTSDGNAAYAYPLDTTISRAIVDIEYTGSNADIGDFWTMEDIDDTPANGVYLKRWRIDNYTLKLQQTITLDTDSNDTFQCDNFAVESYDITFGANEATGQTNLSLSSTDNIAVGTVLCLGPSTYTGSIGSIERVTVSAIPPTCAAGTVNVSTPITANYSSGDPISFYRNIWVFNDYYQKAATGGLYKINSSSGSIISRDSGGEYNAVDACTFDGATGYLLYMKGYVLRWVDVSDPDLPVYQQAIQDNREASGDGGSLSSTVIPVKAIAIEGNNIYRLQAKATYLIDDTYHTYSWSTLNYQLATTTPFVTSVSVTATPSIVPADGATTSAIVATVRDQFDAVMSGKTVTFAANDGSISPASDISDANGQSQSTYTSGTEANQVTITVTASQ